MTLNLFPCPCAFNSVFSTTLLFAYVKITSLFVIFALAASAISSSASVIFSRIKSSIEEQSEDIAALSERLTSSVEMSFLSQRIEFPWLMDKGREWLRWLIW